VIVVPLYFQMVDNWVINQLLQIPPLVFHMDMNLPMYSDRPQASEAFASWSRQV